MLLQARKVLTAVRATLPDAAVVVLSNLSACDAAHAETVRAELGDLLDASYFSYREKLAKPDWRLFSRVAAEQGCGLDRLVHIGDSVEADARAALLAGGRAVLLGEDDPDLGPPQRFRRVGGLPEVVGQLAVWRESDRATLPVRAEALITNEAGEILVVRGPDDEDWVLPGGRCERRADEDPAQACAREIGEELGLDVRVTSDDTELVAWSYQESKADENKIVHVFRLPMPDQTTVKSPAEIALCAWMPEVRAQHTFWRAAQPSGWTRSGRRATPIP
ncbi:NUDIX domain-containing protein [Saccharopolyspora pogona]|uniref:NUDIX domain-containing protein n=1 Tax=Saccharopolyspora pogona TaxID=333966 RepID=UPI001682E9AF|nr:NUDIX domain-containing protein [Saccharopolyspora pogona]